MAARIGHLFAIDHVLVSHAAMKCGNRTIQFLLN